MKPIAVLALLLSISCSSLRSGVGSLASVFEDPAPAASQTAPLAYKQAIDAFKNGEYDKASTGFSLFLKDEPTSPYSQVAMFNWGRSLEALGKFQEATEKYRAVIEATNRRAPKLQALALYQISFAYEGMGDDAKTIASLRDANARKDFLPLSVATAELPARLASAYSRTGNMDTAFQFYTQAEAGIVRLRSQSEKQLPDWLPQTYYQMGRLAQGELTWENLAERMRPIEKGQIYLLQAMEFSHPVWSKKAAEELRGIYDQILSVISAPPEKGDDDILLSRRDAQEKQWSMTETALEMLRKLKGARPPKEKSPPESVSELYKDLVQIEKRFRKILSEPRLGEGLTPEAQRRKNAPRGRVVDPSSELEKNYLKEKSKSLPEKSSKDDPNL